MLLQLKTITLVLKIHETSATELTTINAEANGTLKLPSWIICICLVNTFLYINADSLNMLSYTFGTEKLMHIFELSQSTLANQKKIHSNWSPSMWSHWAQLAGKLYSPASASFPRSLGSPQRRTKTVKKGQALKHYSYKLLLQSYFLCFL